MGFPSVWVSWIKACLHSTLFSIIINGQHTSWFSPSKGVRQGDPISPYLFILVSQNLSAILNHARYLNMIFGFYKDLVYNFNRLMYADDLILVTNSSRKTSCYIKLCLSIYAHLTGQNPNPSKFEIYFLD